ncbi:hypothetical protein GIB67_006786 [Kingdonia uniflora]|uniref:Uncharacterized protein n=1 Tax=Kingdonia uniflora TaxID=39325 RepID=A0A7J7L040_9MAGN|nr:hypothetical protein GIB67_006786 [Kingdonia uniflora]
MGPAARKIVCWWPWKDRVFSWHRKRACEIRSEVYKVVLDDSTVKTWLINFMQSTISVGYLFTNNAHRI